MTTQITNALNENNLVFDFVGTDNNNLVVVLPKSTNKLQVARVLKHLGLEFTITVFGFEIDVKEDESLNTQIENAKLVSLKSDLVRLQKIHALYNELDAIEIDSKSQRTIQIMSDISNCKKQIKELENVDVPTKPIPAAKDVKKLIRSNLKLSGSHLGTVKHALETKYPNVEWSEYKEFAEKEQQKIFDKTEITIRKSVRYQ